MSKFAVYKTLKLDFLGEGWQDCYLKFNAVPYDVFANIRERYDLDFSSQATTPEEAQKELANDPKKAEKANAFVIRFLSDYFVEGKGFDGKEVVEVKKVDLKDLPMSVINKASDFLMEKEAISPNM